MKDGKTWVERVAQLVLLFERNCAFEACFGLRMVEGETLFGA